MSIQSIRRALTLPPVASDADDAIQQFIRGYYVMLAQQTNILQSHFQSFIRGGVGGATVITMDVPQVDTNYGVCASPDANVGSLWFTGKTTKLFTCNTSLAGPANVQFLVWSNS